MNKPEGQRTRCPQDLTSLPEMQCSTCENLHDTKPQARLRIKVSLFKGSSIYVYTPGSPFQCTPAPSPPAEGREQECSEKVSLGVYTYILPKKII